MLKSQREILRSRRAICIVQIVFERCAYIEISKEPPTLI